MFHNIDDILDNYILVILQGFNIFNIDNHVIGIIVLWFMGGENFYEVFTYYINHFYPCNFNTETNNSQR